MVVVGEVAVGLDDLVQVGLHELEDHVDVLEVVRAGGKHDVLDLDDVGVLQQPHQLDLAQDADGVGLVLEHLFFWSVLRSSRQPHVLLTLLIFLMATISPVALSMAEATTP